MGAPLAVAVAAVRYAVSDAPGGAPVLVFAALGCGAAWGPWVPLFASAT
ncbi:MAG: hypothetical protein ABUR63_02645 [Verrucomicrobiota bacterium]